MKVKIKLTNGIQMLTNMINLILVEAMKITLLSIMQTEQVLMVRWLNIHQQKMVLNLN